MKDRINAIGSLIAQALYKAHTCAPNVVPHLNAALDLLGKIKPIILDETAMDGETIDISDARGLPTKPSRSTRG